MKLQLCSDKGEVLGTEHIDGSCWTSNGRSFVCQEFVEVWPLKAGKATRFDITDNGGSVILPGSFAGPMQAVVGKPVEFKPGGLVVNIYSVRRVK
jgi:hypothetical protein